MYILHHQVSFPCSMSTLPLHYLLIWTSKISIDIYRDNNLLWACTKKWTLGSDLRIRKVLLIYYITSSRFLSPLLLALSFIIVAGKPAADKTYAYNHSGRNTIKGPVLSPNRLFKMGRIPAPKCAKCGQEGADLLHLMLYCRSITGYWQQVISKLVEIIKRPVPDTMEVSLLGLLEEERWPRYTKIFLQESGGWRPVPYKSPKDKKMYYLGTNWTRYT